MGKKICFIGSGLKGGGQERALTNLANYFAKSNYGVTIINLFKTEQFYELDDNVSIVWPEIERRKHNRYVYAMLVLPYLRKAVKKNDPDVLISFGEWFNPYVIFGTLGLNYPIFISDRLNPDLRLGLVLDISKRMLYKKSAGIVAQTEYAATILKHRTGAENIVVIPNPIPKIIFPKAKKKKQIITVGRLSKEKGHIHLIDAFSLLTRKDWILHIIGDGPERSKLEARTIQLGIQERVTFHGHLKDFTLIMVESEIFVLPSLSEGFPNALLEAMSVPLACISSNCRSGPSDIIKHRQNGILVEPQNVESLANAINELIENKELREFLAGNAVKIRDELAIEEIAKRYLEFFKL